MEAHSLGSPDTCSEPGGRDSSANTSPGVTPPSKIRSRKRSRPNSSGTTANDVVPPSSLSKPFKVPRRVQNLDSSQTSQPAQEPTPPASMEQAMSDITEQSLPPSASSLRERNNARNAEPRSPARDPQGHLEALEYRLTKNQYETAELQAQLREQREMYDHNTMVLKQEMMLDIVKINEVADKKIKTLNREKYYLQKEAGEHKGEIANIKLRLDTLTSKYNKTLADMNAYKDETEHLSAENKSLEEDVDALRQIENEEAARRLQQSQGLPPAYGSLNDKDQLPPYQQHRDSGAFDVASFKRSIRSQFITALLDAESRSQTLRSSTDPNAQASADASMFYCTSLALSDACRQLRTALDAAQSVLSTNFVELAVKVNPGCLSTPETKREISRQIARRDYVADRIAKLILDLSWRVVSACELRPTILRLSSQDKAKVALAYKEADEVLLEALRQAFSGSDTSNNGQRQQVAPAEILDTCVLTRRPHIVYEYQDYLTQIEAICKRFANLHAGLSYRYFSKTDYWLCEQVEAERVNHANGAAAPTPTTTGTANVSTNRNATVLSSDNPSI